MASTQDEVSVQIKAQIDQLVSGLDGAVKALSTGFGELLSKVNSLSNGLEKNLGGAAERTTTKAKEMRQEFEGVGDLVDSLKGRMDQAFKVTGIAIAYEIAKKFAEQLHEIADRAEEMINTADAFGITTRELQGLEAVAISTGNSAEALRKGMLMVQQQMTAAAGGSLDAAIKLERVGISIADIRDPAFTAADALVKMAQSGASNSEIMEVLGSRNAKLLDAIRGLKGGMQEATAAGAKLGALNREEIERLAEYKKRTAELDVAWQNFKARIALEVIPAFQKLIDAIQGLLDAFDKLPENSKLMKWLETLSKLSLSVANPILAATIAFKELQNAIAGSQGGNSSPGHGAIGQRPEKRPEGARSVPSGNGLLDQLTPVSPGGSLDLSLAQENTKKQIAIAQEAAAQKRDIALAEIEVQHSMAQERYTIGEINAAQLMKVEQQLVDEKLAIEVSYYEDLKKLHADDSEENLRLNTQIIKAEENAMVQRAAIHAQAMRTIQRNWQQMMRPVVEAFTDGITAMIERTLTFGQAVHAVLNQMLTQVIRTTTTAVARWLTAEHAKTAATVAGETTRAAVVEAGHKKGLMASIGSALKEIFIAAYTASANVYKSVSAIPYVGWILAPIAAAATFAVVAGYAASVSSAKGGMWQVDGDQYANIHKDESVLPANIAAPMREFFTQRAQGGTSGGDSGGSSRVVIGFTPVGKDHGLISKKDMAKAMRVLGQRFAYTGAVT
jgi:hypothetical protein